MSTTITEFIKELQEYQAENVFNPWRDYEPGLDVGPEAPAMRTANLKRYLEMRQNAHYLFIAEGLGYQGGHFSGIAITSERIMLGKHASVAQKSVLGDWKYERTSNPDSPLLNRTQKLSGFNEPTDTVVWNALNEHGLAAQDVILWNIFPFHPHKPGNLLSNRTPTPQELQVGWKYAESLMELVPNMQIVAIGQKAGQTLKSYGVACTKVRHPSMGGANEFRAAVAELFKR